MQVLEETGYDLSEQINPANVVELSIRDQSLSLYIVPNVPEDYEFETRTRKEISVRLGRWIAMRGYSLRLCLPENRMVQTSRSPNMEA